MSVARSHLKNLERRRTPHQFPHLLQLFCQQLAEQCAHMRAGIKITLLANLNLLLVVAMLRLIKGELHVPGHCHRARRSYFVEDDFFECRQSDLLLSRAGKLPSTIQ